MSPFYIFNSKLYIDSSVLNFNMPSGNYSIQIELIDSDTDQIIDTTTHTVFVNPCQCPE
jgi:hypothetical protein